MYNQSVIAVIENEIFKILKRNKSRHSVIIALFKGRKLPKYCVLMPRNPSFKINTYLNNNLSKIYFLSQKKNSSIIDGAILIQLDYNTTILRGFSYRLFPPPSKTPRLENKGSGYNSSLDFSVVRRVICVYFINKKAVIKFVNGKEKIIFK
jgi:hypothetical protein